MKSRERNVPAVGMSLLAASLLAALACGEPSVPSDAAVVNIEGRDEDAVRLAWLGARARRVAGERSGRTALRQVDTDLTRVVFHFSDPAATAITRVVVPTVDAPSREWLIETDLISPLVGHPTRGLDLRELRAGPRRLARALTSRWPGCAARGLTLHSDGGGAMRWTGFCDTPAGVVTGSVDQSGAFLSSDAPPSRPPRVAPPPR